MFFEIVASNKKEPAPKHNISDFNTIQIGSPLLEGGWIHGGEKKATDHHFKTERPASRESDPQRRSFYGEYLDSLSRLSSQLALSSEQEKRELAAQDLWNSDHFGKPFDSFFLELEEEEVEDNMTPDISNKASTPREEQKDKQMEEKKLLVTKLDTMLLQDAEPLNPRIQDFAKELEAIEDKFNDGQQQTISENHPGAKSSPMVIIKEDYKRHQLQKRTLIYQIYM